jgi:hypothetical protein
VSDELQKAFGDARASGNVRFIKVSIEDGMPPPSGSLLCSPALNANTAWWSNR